MDRGLEKEGGVAAVWKDLPVEAIHAGAEENVCGVEGEEGEEWREKEERRRWWTSCHLGRVLLHSQPSSACTG